MNNEAKTDRERILDRIQKCLRLSKSSEPNEAAAALRQAQKMMAAHSVGQAEILGLEIQSVQVVTVEPWKRKMPLYMNHLINTIAKAFDVQPLIEVAYKNGKPRMAIRYFGKEGRPDLAAYAHEVMWRQLRSSWNAYAKLNPWVVSERGARQGFWIGWLQEVRGKIMTFAGNKEERELIGKAMEAYAGGKLKESKTNSMSLDSHTRSAGRDAAGDFSIHRPMNGEKQRQLS